MDNKIAELIIAFKKGDQSAFDLLIKEYLKSVLNFVYRYVYDVDLAQDITQETFIKVWKNIKKFDTSKNFKPWLFQIAKNTALDFIKKKKLVPFSSFKNNDTDDDFVDNIPDESLSALDIINFQEQKQQLDLHLQELTPDQQLVIFLYYYEELTFREISETLDISINTIKSRYLRGLEKLKTIMHQN